MARTAPASRRRRAIQTQHVVLDRCACEACGRCVEICPAQVLLMIENGRHRHAKIRDAAACTGCFACVRACEVGALTRRASSETG